MGPLDMKTHTAGAVKVGLLYLMVLVGASLVSRVLDVTRGLRNKDLIQNEWPLEGGSGNNWPRRLLGTFMPSADLEMISLTLPCLPFLLSPHSLAFTPNHFLKTSFARVTNDLIAKIQESLFSFHSTCQCGHCWLFFLTSSAFVFKV